MIFPIFPRQKMFDTAADLARLATVKQARAWVAQGHPFQCGTSRGGLGHGARSLFASLVRYLQLDANRTAATRTGDFANPIIDHLHWIAAVRTVNPVSNVELNFGRRR